MKSFYRMHSSCYCLLVYTLLLLKCGEAEATNICASNLNLLRALSDEFGQDLEVYVAVPGTSIFDCFANVTIPSYMFLSFTLCSSGKGYWDTLDSANKSVSQPVYIIFACPVDESIRQLQLSFSNNINLRWILLYNSQPPATQKLVQSLSSLYLNLNTMLLLTDENDVHSIQEVYKLNNASALVQRDVPSWATQGERWRSNFHGAPLRVTGVMSDEYSYDTKMVLTSEGVPILQDSFAFQILSFLQFTMNFTIDARVAYTWGFFNEETQAWDGMIQDLLNGDADLAISSTADLPFRRAAVDFNLPTNELRLTGFFRKPRNSADAKALIEPFGISLWLALVSTITALSLSLIIFKKVLVRVARSDPSAADPSDWMSDSESVKFKLHKLDMIGSREQEQPSSVQEYFDPNALWCPSDCFQWAIGIFCYQGFYDIPRQDCYRIVVGLGCLSSVIIYGAYGGTLISFLSVDVNSINNLEQLLSNSFVFSIVGFPVSEKFFRDSPSRVDQTIYRKRRLNPMYYGLGEAKNPVLKGSFMFFVDHISGYNNLNELFTIRENCLIQELHVPYAAQKQGSMVPKNSPYKRIIDYEILRMNEYGVIHQFNKRYIPARRPCKSGITFDGVQFASVSVAFAVLALGALLSILLIFIEKLIQMRQTKKESVYPGGDNGQSYNLNM